jgi:hypothetical protein
LKWLMAMAHRHGKSREKKEKKSPAKRRIGMEDAILRLRCTLCDKTDCIHKIECPDYKTVGGLVSGEIEEDEEMEE